MAAVALAVQSNADDVLKRVLASKVNLEKVVKYALSDTVDDLLLVEKMEMRRVFNNPRPYTMNALFGKYPSSRGVGVINAGIAAREVGVKGTPAYKYLMPNIKGGKRRMKRSEKGLQTMGILEKNVMLIQGRDYPRDAYGDIPGGQYTRMLAELGVVANGGAGLASLTGSKGKAKPRKDESKRFFIMKRQKGARPFAIAERNGGGIRIMLVYQTERPYKKRYDFYGIGKETILERYPKHFSRIFNRMNSKLS
jgi:hypothetical protein